MFYLAAGLFICTFLVYFASPVTQVSDSRYSMLTAESIIHNHTPDLSGYTIKHDRHKLPFNTIRGQHAYQLAYINGRLLYGFPIGTSLLSLPFVAVMDAAGVSPATPDRKFNLAGEVSDQKMLAALLMAALVVVFFRTSLILLDWGWSIVVALGSGLGTQMWSTGSRAMWSNTWEMTLAGLVAYLLLDSEMRHSSSRPVILATLLSWMFFVRPTGAGPIVCVSIYILICRRHEFLPFAVTGAAWICAYLLYSMRIYGTLFIPYYHQLWGPNAQWIATGLFGTLFSPSRGLFVYCPVLLIVAYLLIRNWRALASRRLVAVSVFSCASIWLAVALHMDWWGGNCYGPRYLSAMVPWMVMLAIMAIATIPAGARKLRNPVVAVGALLLGLSVVINAHGALSFATLHWNNKRPLPGVILDWSQPQFLAGWIDESPSGPKSPVSRRISSASDSGH